ncbi:UNVERIFIED_CONTAM: hypothetical protein HHA_233290 [Hammondia hammondi]|eukprot:XP_008882776.1 hypothetical protein HHA_233290 [Hammondia hammondi]
MASGLPLKHVANFLLPGADRYNLRQPESKLYCQTRTDKAVQPVNDGTGTARALPVFRRKTCVEEIAEAFDLSGPQLTRQQFIAAFTDPVMEVSATFLSQVFDMLIESADNTHGHSSGTLDVDDLVWYLLTQEESLGPACDAADDLRMVLRRATENMVHADPVKAFSSTIASRFFSCIGNSNYTKLDNFTRQFMAPSTKFTCGRPLVDMRYELIKQLTTQLSSEVEHVSKVVDERILHMVEQLDADVEELKRRERMTRDRNEEFGPPEIVLPQVSCAHAQILDVRGGRRVVITDMSAKLSMKPSLALDPYGGYDSSIEEIDWLSRSRVCSISCGAGTVTYY